MATRSSTFVWKITWTEEPRGLGSKGSQGVDSTQQLSTQARTSQSYQLPVLTNTGIHAGLKYSNLTLSLFFLAGT